MEHPLSTNSFYKRQRRARAIKTYYVEYLFPVRFVEKIKKKFNEKSII